MKGPQPFEVAWGGYEQLGPQNVQPKNVLHLDLTGNVRPEVLTLALGREGEGGVNLFWRARVQFGLGKLVHSLLCDWGTGVMLRLPASSVYVTAEPYSPRLTSINSSGQNLFLTAGVALGAFGGVPPTLTEKLASIVALGTGAQNAPPPFARAVSIYNELGAGTTDPYVDLTAQWQLPGGSVIGNVPGGALTAGAWMPIPNDGRLVLINGNAGDSMQPTLVWHLDAGA